MKPFLSANLMITAILGLAAMAGPALVGSAMARDIMVGPGTQYRSLGAAVRASDGGDRLLLQAGVYRVQDLVIPHDLVLEGVAARDVIITSQGAVAKGLLVPGPGTAITVRKMTFEGARSPDKNGAGIRFEGSVLTVEKCTFRDNENGILATGDPHGGLKVIGSSFERNGHGDGFSHGIYQSRGARFEILDSVFTGTKIGHHLKSLASLVSVSGNRFDDGTGEPSYVVDATGGGRLFITSNQIIRRASASQDNLFNYDTSRGGSLGSVMVADNVITTEKPRINILRNPERAPQTLDANELRRSGSGSFNGFESVAVPAVPQSPAALIAAPARVEAPVAPDAAPAVASGVDDDRLARLTPQQRRAVLAMAPQLAPKASASLGLRLGASRSGMADNGAARPRISGQGLLRAPTFKDAPAEALARFKVRRLVRGGSAFLTFGQTFSPGAVRPSDEIAAVIEGETVGAQLDAKATHPDGSVRHGVVTVQVPTDARDGADGYLLLGKLFGQTGTPSPDLLPEMLIQLEGNLGDGEIIRYEASLATILARSPSQWLTGSLAVERSGVQSFGPLLNVRADARAHADGSGRVRITFENHKTFSTLPRDLAYSVSITRDGIPVLDETIGNHYRNSSWTVVFDTKSAPAFDVIHDPASFIQDAALPPLDLGQVVNRDSLSKERGQVRPGIHAPLTPYQPTTGGRHEIGPMTGWAASWAITQDPDAKAAMLRVAEIGLTIPWHFADDKTGLPVRADMRKRFWADARGAQDNFAPDQFPETLFSGNKGGWTIDIAHKPSLSFPAYLATGEAIYARALGFEASFAVTGVWPDLRQDGTIVVRGLQLRSAAWGMRTIGNAAWILPDNDPLKSYFQSVLTANIRDLRSRYLVRGEMDGAGETEGYLAFGTRRGEVAIPPWQNDFMAIVLAQETLRGTPGARDLVGWMTPFVAGRVLAPGSTVDLAAGAHQIVMSPDGRRLSRWQDVFAATNNEPAEPVYTGSAEGGYGILRSALGAISRATNDPTAAAALAELRTAQDADKLTAPNNQLGLAWNPQFAIED